MAYKQININQFKGLNSTVAPELIDDGEARDILNFRMEKVGKLVSRNGYICGLFTPPCTPLATHPGCVRTTVNTFNISPQVKAYVENNGIIGIGEYVLSEKWESLDTDRFMVYVVRALDGGDSESISGVHPKRHSEFYLFSPLTGKYTNQLMTDYDAFSDPESVDLSNKRDSYAQGTEHTVSLFAPNKRDPGNSDTFDDNDEWISHYVDLNQYRNQIVISDRINGDMLLEDEWDRRDINACDDAGHRFHLRPNALADFNIDIVEIDPRFGNENSAEDGVETAMVLYRYVLPKKQLKVLGDHFENDISLLENISDGEDVLDDRADADKAATKLLQKYHSGVDAFFSIYAFYVPLDNGNWWYVRDIGTTTVHVGSCDKTQGVDVSQSAVVTSGIPPSGAGACNLLYRINESKYYQFSTEINPGKFDDILGELEFEKDEYVNEDGEVVTESAVNTYVWDNYKIKYYPCSGNEIYTDGAGITNFSRYLKDIDRKFEKLVPGLGRLTELNAKDNAGRKVPLGVWKYRFVWDFGDGYYSAPSAELVVPDIMWSPTKDEDYWTGTTYNYTGRPNKLTKEDLLYCQPIENANTNYDSYPGYLDFAGDYYYYPNIINSGGSLTSLGENIHAIKKKLYDATHRYGMVAEDVTTLEDYEKARIGVMATAFFSESVVQMPGMIWEGCGVSIGQKWSHDGSPYGGVDGREAIDKNVITGSGGLAVPIFKAGVPLTYNSLFDDEGRFRGAFDDGPIRHQLVLPGNNYGVGQNTWDYNKDLNKNAGCGSFTGSEMYRLKSVVPASEMLAHQYLSGRLGSIYYNYVRCDYDKNNKDDDDVYLPARSHTILRAVKSESDRLTMTAATDIPPEALTRLILTGMAEIEVVAQGEKVYFESEKQYWQQGTSILWNIFYTDADAWYYMYHEPATTPIDEVERTRHTMRVGGGIKPDLTVRGWRGVEPTSKFIIYAEVHSDTYEHGEWYDYADNLGIYVYGNAERLTLIEQLTDVFPSSILFESPRLGIKIHRSLVPAKAKKLLIYRTKCTHANDYEPTVFGLVEEVDLRRYTDKEINEHGTIEKSGTELDKNDVFSEMGDGEWIGGISGTKFYDGVYYFDEVKDSELSFTKVPDDYEGLRNPLKSRFNISVNERTFYLNFIEEYQPQSPRKNEHEVELDAGGDSIELPTADAVVMESENDEGYSTQVYVRYKYVYEDITGVLSEAKRVNADGSSIYVNGAVSTKVVVLYLMPSLYDASIKKLRIYRAKKEGEDWASGDTVNYSLIGEVEAGDEGIFVDINQIGGALLECINPAVFEYNSGMMESEPFRPDWIKPEKMYEYRSGDGKVITGVGSLYGNIVVYKETSMHRVAVQGKNPAVSRTDEISPEIGCIAPNSLINIDGTHYFLSWKGFMRYDNNRLMKIDGKFDEELQYILSTVPSEYLRDASCGYNRSYNEIYLNIPMLKTDDVRQRDYGHGEMYQKNDDNESKEYFKRTLLGHIYIINLDKGYATKFAYPATIDDLTYLESPGNTLMDYVKDVAGSQQMIRLYYDNSLGELRSADVLPVKWQQSVSKAADSPEGKRMAGIWIETPYNINHGIWHNGYYWNYRKMAKGGAQSTTEDEQIVLTDYDDVIDGSRLYESYPDDGYYGEVIDPIYPPLTVWPIRSEYRSKFFTGTLETLIKRVRKTLVNIFTRGGTTIKNITVPLHNENESYDYDNRTGERADERIEQKPHIEEGSDYGFSSSIDAKVEYAHYIMSKEGTGTNILATIPREIDGDDWAGKPVRYSIEVKSELRTQINSVEIYWRPIHTYLG